MQLGSVVRSASPRSPRARRASARHGRRRTRTAAAAPGRCSADALAVALDAVPVTDLEQDVDRELAQLDVVVADAAERELLLALLEQRARASPDRLRPGRRRRAAHGPDVAHAVNAADRQSRRRRARARVALVVAQRRAMARHAKGCASKRRAPSVRDQRAAPPPTGGRRPRVGRERGRRPRRRGSAPASLRAAGMPASPARWLPVPPRDGPRARPGAFAVQPIIDRFATSSRPKPCCTRHRHAGAGTAGSPSACALAGSSRRRGRRCAAASASSEPACARQAARELVLAHAVGVAAEREQQLPRR